MCRCDGWSRANAFGSSEGRESLHEMVRVLTMPDRSCMVMRQTIGHALESGQALPGEGLSAATLMSHVAWKWMAWPLSSHQILYQQVVNSTSMCRESIDPGWKLIYRTFKHVDRTFNHGVSHVFADHPRGLRDLFAAPLNPCTAQRAKKENTSTASHRSSQRGCLG